MKKSLERQEGRISKLKEFVKKKSGKKGGKDSDDDNGKDDEESNE